MGKREIDDFSDDSLAEIAKCVRTLRWQVQNVQELAKAVKRQRPTHEIRTGVTAARPDAEYPESGCVLPVQFTDLAFDEQGSQSGECEPLEKAVWPLKFVSARTIEGTYIKEGQDVLIVKTAGKKGRRWWIIPVDKQGGRIGFRMTSVRSRLRNDDDTRYGQATAVVIWTAGTVPVKKGETVTVTFPGIMYAGAVKNCEGFADYFSSYSGTSQNEGGCSGGSSEWYWSPQDHAWSLWASGNHCGSGCTPSPPSGIPSDPSEPANGTGGCIANTNFSAGTPGSEGSDETINQDIYLVTDCEEKPAFIEFVLLEDRDYNVPNQKVAAIPRIAWGHNNCHLSLDKWYQQQGGNGTFDCGTLKWEWIPNESIPEGGQWEIGLAEGSVTPSTCCIPDYTAPPPPEPRSTQGHVVLRPFGEPGPNCEPPTEQPEFYVLFPQLEHPEALEGSDGTADFFDAPESDDPKDCIYIVRVANQRSPIVSSELTSAMCGQDPSTTAGSPKLFWPLSMPAPNGVYPYKNLENHAGESGDSFTADWDNAARYYRVKDVKKHKVTAMINYSDTTDANGCRTITHETQEMYIELCAPPVAGTPRTMKLRTVSNVESLTVDKNESGSGSASYCQEPTLDIGVSRMSVWVDSCDPPTPDIVSFELSVDEFTIDVVDDGVCIYQTKIRRLHLGDCGTEWDNNVICSTDEQCESGSG